MWTLEIQNIPQELYDLLKASADRSGRSLEQEAIVLLEKVLTENEDNFRKHPRFITEITSAGKLTKKERDLVTEWIRKDRER